MGIQAFFNVSKTTSKSSKYKGGCFSCGLHAFCKSPKMEAAGKGKLGILILTEYPTAEEDRTGELLANVAGQRLERELARLHINLWKDCRILPAVQCNPRRVVKGKRVSQVTDDDIAFCRARVMQEIKEFQPKVILCLGPAAIKSICQHRGFETGFPSITNWQGELIPDRELGTYVLTTWNLSYVLSQVSQNSIYLMKWRETVSKLKKAITKNPPVPLVLEDQVEVVINTKQAAKRLKEIYNQIKDENALIAFDYETTGIKPYVDGHKIISTAICYERNKAIAFFMDDHTWPWLERFLRNKNIRKTAHNMKFEHIWTSIRGQNVKDKKGFEIKGWWWDSMLGAFILDNRTGRTGLKFLTYAKLGVVGYDSFINQYIKSNSKDNNAFNTITSAPARELLLYNAIDTLATRRLALLQEKAINKDEGLKTAYKLWHEGALALADAEIRGIKIDRNYCELEIERISKEIDKLEKRMLSYPEVKVWKKKYGDAFKLSSPDQLRWLLYEHLGMEKTKFTDTGLGSADKTIIEDIDLPFAQDKIAIAELAKVRDTYLKGFLRESPDGFLHPNFNLNTVVSYRGSCVAKGSLVMVNRDYENNRIGIPIEDVKVGDFVFCFDDALKPALRKVLWSGKTGCKEVVRLYFMAGKGKKGYLDVTPEHLIRMSDGSYIAAKDILKYSCKVGVTKKRPNGMLKCSVLSMHRTGTDKDLIYATGGYEFYEHHFIYEQITGKKVQANQVIHHKNDLHLHNHIITGIEYLPNKVDVYDLKVEDVSNFIVNEICVHNCTNPNFQNIPKRNPIAQKSTRQALCPHDGFLWLEIDYSSIEVRVAATYHKDPNMLRYLNDPHSDMHRDMAMQCIGLEEDNVSKYLRNSVKNGLVFPFFYGDYFKQCAENMWNKWFKLEAATTNKGLHVYKHLKKELGIKNLSHFISHLKKVEDHFWNERFPVYAEWREQNWLDYQKTGFLRAHTGFIYKGEIMNAKQTSNYPTQGSGFHCLMRSLVLINKKFKRERWKSFLNGQIHDAVDGNVYPSEINKALPMMRSLMVDDLVKAYKWINVPMDVEFELAPINKSWYNLKQVFLRDKACKCGLEWGYSKKTDSGTIIWDCPVCGGFKLK